MCAPLHLERRDGVQDRYAILGNTQQPSHVLHTCTTWYWSVYSLTGQCSRPPTTRQRGRLWDCEATRGPVPNHDRQMSNISGGELDAKMRSLWPAEVHVQKETRQHPTKSCEAVQHRLDQFRLLFDFRTTSRSDKDTRSASTMIVFTSSVTVVFSSTTHATMTTRTASSNAQMRWQRQRCSST